jgi:hypothetical protein
VTASTDGTDGYVVRDLLRRRHSLVNAIPSRARWLHEAVRGASPTEGLSGAVDRRPIQLTFDFAPPRR